MTHHPECEDATGEYPGSCTCALIKRRQAMDELIAQDADLIDVETITMTEITQADRDAAVEYLEYFGEDWHAMEVLKGLGDNFKSVQLFARHREKAAAEERAKIAAWLRSFATDKTDDLADILEANEDFQLRLGHLRLGAR